MRQNCQYISLLAAIALVAATGTAQAAYDPSAAPLPLAGAGIVSLLICGGVAVANLVRSRRNHENSDKN